MPESSESSNVFLGEFFWSPAFQYHNILYFYHEGWTRNHENKIPREILVSTDKFLKESSTFDCSIDDTFSIYTPCSLIVEEMKLNLDADEGRFYDEQGKLIAFDPSLKEIGSNTCLVRYDSFLNFLAEKDYDILWIVLGEKNILHHDFTFRGRLEINGASRLQNGIPTGKINPKFLPPHSSA